MKNRAEKIESMTQNIGFIVGDISKSAGTERAVINLANILSKHNFNIKIISIYTSDNQDAYYQLETNIQIIHLNKKRGRGIKKIEQYIRLLAQIKKISCSNSMAYILGTTHAYNCMLALIPMRTKKIGCEHMSYYSCPKRSRIIRRMLYPKLDKIVTLTETDKRNYTFIPEKKLEAIPNSLSFECKNPSDLKFKRVIAVGRLCNEKGFDLLIEAIDIAFSVLEEWQLDIFGEGEEQEKLQKLIDKHKLTRRVSIHPPTKNIESELIRSSIFVMSSRKEGFGLALLEAAECGLPCVSFEGLDGPEEIIKNEENGFLVQFGNTKMLAEKIIELAENYEKRVEFGKCARQTAKRFSDDEIYKMWKKILG